jgi:predicted TIM-barrel fold metal-dependent hydrolase
VHEHLKFTPFPGEPVGWMIEQAGPDLFMFSTDFPHPEGGRDPKAKFEDAMADVDDAALDRFYHGNMAELLGPARVPVGP